MHATWMLGIFLLTTRSCVALRANIGKFISSTRLLNAPKGTKKGEAPPMGAEELRKVRLDKIETMRTANINPFAYTFLQTHKTAALQDTYKSLADGVEDTSAVVSVAGRIMARRVFGKLAFFELQDDTGSIQLYIESNRLGDEFKNVKDWTDAGDIIGTVALSSSLTALLCLNVCTCRCHGNSEAYREG